MTDSSREKVKIVVIGETSPPRCLFHQVTVLGKKMSKWRAFSPQDVGLVAD